MPVAEYGVLSLMRTMSTPVSVLSPENPTGPLVETIQTAQKTEGAAAEIPRPTDAIKKTPDQLAVEVRGEQTRVEELRRYLQENPLTTSRDVIVDDQARQELEILQEKVHKIVTRLNQMEHALTGEKTPIPSQQEEQPEAPRMTKEDLHAYYTALQQYKTTIKTWENIPETPDFEQYKRQMEKLLGQLYAYYEKISRLKERSVDALEDAIQQDLQR